MKTFEIQDVEWERCKAFMEEHKECCGDKPFSTLGMQFSYEITPGGFGNLVSIKCNACGDSKDVTDTSNW